MVKLMRRLRHARKRGERGFTLIEVLVAMGILATGLLAVSAAQLYAMRGGRSGRHTTDAAEIAQTQIEELNRLAWTDANLAQTAGWTPAVTRDREIETEGAPVVEQTYSLTWRITNVNNWVKTIDVRVDWDEPNRPGRSYTITTVRHNDARS
jgi:prepilin-type N-terminal cleavage/methylation domain-containing protein